MAAGQPNSGATRGFEGDFSRAKSEIADFAGHPGRIDRKTCRHDRDGPLSSTTHAKVVIIGSGPAGYTAGIYAARAMLDPILIQGMAPGGQLTVTTDVENYPGFAEVIQGPWLMEHMQIQAAHVGTRLVADHVNKFELARRPFRIE